MTYNTIQKFGISTRYFL